jgi:hypothetical protein
MQFQRTTTGSNCALLALIWSNSFKFLFCFVFFFFVLATTMAL